MAARSWILAFAKHFLLSKNRLEGSPIGHCQVPAAAYYSSEEVSTLGKDVRVIMK